MPIWDMFFRIGADSKPLRQDLERIGAHMEQAGKKIGQRFGLTWKDAMAGVVIGAITGIGFALAGSLRNATENIREAAKLGLPTDEFIRVKALAEETGLSVEDLVKALRHGGNEAKNLRVHMDRMQRGVIGQPDWARGSLKAWANAARAGLQTAENMLGTALAAIGGYLTIGAGAVNATAKGIGTLRTGGVIGAGKVASDTLGDAIADAMTRGQTAEVDARLAVGWGRVAQQVMENEKKKPQPRTWNKWDPGVEADSLAKAGILYSRFGVQGHFSPWEDKMLETTKVIATNTEALKSSGPPGPIPN